jgi:FkbM family methyltransferase
MRQAIVVIRSQAGKTKESPMESPTNEAPFGARAPNLFDRAVMALTVRLPDNWAGLKVATALRRLVTMRMDTAGALDVTRWRLHMRLHPRDNGCEKNLLFTPQMYEPPERAELAREIADVGGRPFVFVDVGANVGLFSLYVAATAPAARILAIEPEPGNFARLAFNIAANPGLPIVPLPLALGDAEGTAEIVLNARDRGGTRLAANGTQGRGVAVRCRPLVAVVTEAGLTGIDALKIDVEGAEDKVLVPFFRDAPASLRPRLVVIEDSSAEWSTDLFALLKAKGYAVSSRSKQNVMLRRTP